MRPLTQTDRELLKLLRHNGRASVTDLAATLNLSRVTVKARMTALQADGIIQRFTIDVAKEANQDLIHAISMLSLEMAKIERVAAALIRLPEVTSVYSTNGKWSLIVRTQSNSLGAFDRLLNRIGQINGITDVETCLLLNKVRESKP